MSPHSEYLTCRPALAPSAELGAGFFSSLKQQAAAADAAKPSPAAQQAGAPPSGAPAAAAAAALLDGRCLDFVAPDEVIASLLAQMAREREFSRVVHALLYEGGGCGLRVRPAAAFGAEAGESRRLGRSAAGRVPGYTPN